MTIKLKQHNNMWMYIWPVDDAALVHDFAPLCATGRLVSRIKHIKSAKENTEYQLNHWLFETSNQIHFFVIWRENILWIDFQIGNHAQLVVVGDGWHGAARDAVVDQ